MLIYFYKIKCIFVCIDTYLHTCIKYFTFFSGLGRGWGLGLRGLGFRDPGWGPRLLNKTVGELGYWIRSYRV